jgi:hypothetical protein
MPHRILQPISEAAFAVMTFVTATATQLLLYDNEEQATDALRWLLLPLLGSMLAAGGAILLNPRPEHRKIVFGRSVFAVVFGTTVPKLTSLLHPWLQSYYVEPAAILLSGFIIAVTVYVLSKSFVQKFYDRADRIAEERLNKLEERFGTTAKPAQPSVSKDDTPPG